MIYRHRMQIIADILDVTSNGAKQTDIMYKANLSYRLLEYYLGTLTESGTICLDENSGKYKLTVKGKRNRQRAHEYNEHKKNVTQELEELKIEEKKLSKIFGIK